MDNEKQYKVLLESYQKCVRWCLKTKPLQSSSQRKYSCKKITWELSQSPFTLQANASKHKAATISWCTQSKKKGK